MTPSPGWLAKLVDDVAREQEGAPRTSAYRGGASNILVVVIPVLHDTGAHPSPRGARCVRRAGIRHIAGAFEFHSERIYRVCPQGDNDAISDHRRGVDERDDD